jgi:hypothetical protein
VITLHRKLSERSCRRQSHSEDDAVIHVLVSARRTELFQEEDSLVGCVAEEKGYTRLTRYGGLPPRVRRVQGCLILHDTRPKPHWSVFHGAEPPPRVVSSAPSRSAKNHFKLGFASLGNLWSKAFGVWWSFPAFESGWSGRDGGSLIRELSVTRSKRRRPQTPTVLSVDWTGPKYLVTGTEA